MRLILKIGGSILFENGNISLKLIESWVTTINHLRGLGHEIGIVVGGGIYARKYSLAAKKLGANSSYQDLIGIEVARQNARLFISALRDAYPHPPKDYQELIAAHSSNNLIVLGGFHPGQSTNAVAAIFAEYVEADYLFNLSNITHVYDKDPSKFSDAKPLDRLTYSELSEIIKKNQQSPGKYAVFDTVGMGIVERSGIKLVFLDGHQPQFLLDTLEGKSRGTTVE